MVFIKRTFAEADKEIGLFSVVSRSADDDPILRASFERRLMAASRHIPRGFRRAD